MLMPAPQWAVPPAPMRQGMVNGPRPGGPASMVPVLPSQMQHFPQAVAEDRLLNSLGQAPVLKPVPVQQFLPSQLQFGTGPAGGAPSVPHAFRAPMGPRPGGPMTYVPFAMSGAPPGHPLMHRYGPLGPPPDLFGYALAHPGMPGARATLPCGAELAPEAHGSPTTRAAQAQPTGSMPSVEQLAQTHGGFMRVARAPPPAESSGASQTLPESMPAHAAPRPSPQPMTVPAPWHPRMPASSPGVDDNSNTMMASQGRSVHVGVVPPLPGAVAPRELPPSQGQGGPTIGMWFAHQQMEAADPSPAHPQQPPAFQPTVVKVPGPCAMMGMQIVPGEVDGTPPANPGITQPAAAQSAPLKSQDENSGTVVVPVSQGGTWPANRPPPAQVPGIPASQHTGMGSPLPRTLPREAFARGMGRSMRMPHREGSCDVVPDQPAPMPHTTHALPPALPAGAEDRSRMTSGHPHGCVSAPLSRTVPADVLVASRGQQRVAASKSLRFDPLEPEVAPCPPQQPSEGTPLPAHRAPSQPLQQRAPSPCLPIGVQRHDDSPPQIHASNFCALPQTPSPEREPTSLPKEALAGPGVQPIQREISSEVSRSSTPVNLAAVARAVSIPFGPPGTPVNARSPAHNRSEVHAQSMWVVQREVSSPTRRSPEGTPVHHARTLPANLGVDDKGTGLMATRFGGEQESDMLEKLGDKYKDAPVADPETARVQLVSLGSYCGPKLSFQKMGRGAETLPFDWIRTRMSGILRFLRSNFEGFYDFTTQQRVPETGSMMVMFRGYHHSFWHDDPTEPKMHERYNRRIARLFDINSEVRPVLFVRSIVSNEEVLQIPELMVELRKHFGQSARLLMVLESQRRFNGPAIVMEEPGVYLYYLSCDVHTKDHPDNAMPYARPTQHALDWCIGREPTCEIRRMHTLQDAFAISDPYPGGMQGMGGLIAFEESTPETSPAGNENAMPMQDVGNASDPGAKVMFHAQTANAVAACS